VKSKWLVSAILASGLTAPGFAQVEQGLASQPEISPVAALPDPPGALPFGSAVHQIAIAAVPPRRKFAQVIEPEETAEQFTPVDKMVFSFMEVAWPITLLPALYSASYEQLFNTDPKYGHDAGAFGEKFGASMLRSASVRVFSDGILASALCLSSGSTLFTG
jgi:hypothetical protein